MGRVSRARKDKKKEQPSATPKSPGQVLMKAAKAMPIDRTMHERDSIARFEALGEARKPTAAPLPELPELIAPETTDEQKQIAAAATRVRLLLQQPKYLSIREAMKTFRQGHAIAWRELQALLVAETDVPPLTHDFFVGEAAFQAAQPFSEHDFVAGLVQRVMPWLAETIDQHSGREDEQARAQAQQQDEQRRSTPLPLGFKYHGAQEAPVLRRQRSLTLVGWSAAVNWLLDKIIGLVLEDPASFTVFRLRGAGLKVQRAVEKRYGATGLNQWRGCCNSRNALVKLMGEHLLPQLAAPPDLLICDDLSQALTNSYTGRPRAADGGDAHRGFAWWSSGVGAALVGCLPQPSRTEAIDVAGPDYEQLRGFSDVCQLMTVEAPSAPTKYHISVNHVSVFEVDKEELDAYVPALLVV